MDLGGLETAPYPDLRMSKAEGSMGKAVAVEQKGRSVLAQRTEFSAAWMGTHQEAADCVHLEKHPATGIPQWVS